MTKTNLTKEEFRIMKDIDFFPNDTVWTGYYIGIVEHVYRNDNGVRVKITGIDSTYRQEELTLVTE